MLLIIENSDSICQYFPVGTATEFLNVSDLSLTETLIKLKSYEDVNHLYLPIELKFKRTYRQTLQGLELFRHIRLSSELGKIQFAPILLGYTYPLETIIRNPESTMLCSPATHLFNLKNIHQLESFPFFQVEEALAREILKPYILFTDNDKGKSEHDIRNEYGPLKLESELNEKTSSDIGLALWQKKVLFLQPDIKVLSDEEEFSIAEFKRIIRGKRLLYLDDEAYKWETPLRKLFAGAVLEIKKDFEEIVRYFGELKIEQDKIRSEYTEIDKALWQVFSKNGKNSDFVLKYAEAIKMKSKLVELLNYDLVLLDMRLDKIADRTKTVNQLSGVQILNKIQELNPFIPVIMFTASNKVESYKDVISKGAYDYWIKNASSANDLRKKTFALLKNEMQGKRLGNLKDVYAKLLMIKSRVTISNHSLNQDSSKIVSGSLSALHRERIDNSVWYFINFLQRYSANSIGDADIEELWKLTGDSIQIRVPAIYGLTEVGIKSLDKRRLIKDNEFDFRWNRNYFAHSVVDDKRRNSTLNPYDINHAIDYITHTIEFLLDYR